MKSITLTLLILITFSNAAISIAYNFSEKSIPLIIVKELNDEVVFERLFVKNGKVEEITDSSVITIILPISPGKAANFIKPSDRKGVIIVKNNNGRYDITFKSQDGKEKSFPYPSYETLRTFQIRVNIINGKGYKQAFIIDDYDRIKEDDGPVLDIFAGLIPLEANDYSITLETKIVSSTEKMSGSVPFVKIDEWIIVEAKLPNGKTGRFILDTGGSGGIVLKQNVLPENTEISELKAVAYSGEGSSEEKGQMIAADGAIGDNNFLGIAKLSSFVLGDIKLSDLNVSVLKEFPEFVEKHNIIGIVGINILKRAEIMRIEHINRDNGVVKFLSLDKNQSGSHDYSFSLNTASNLLFLNGTIQDTPVDFLVDIGARRSIISTGIVQNNNFIYSATDDAIVGIGGKKTDAVKGNFPEVKIENEKFKNFPFIISANLFATKAMGLEKSGALLGMSFYSNFSTMEIDFVNNKLYLNK